MNATIPLWSIPAIVVATVAVWSLGSRAYKRTIGRRGHMRRCLNNLSCGTIFTHIEGFLGQSISNTMRGDRVYRTYRSTYAYVVATAPHAERNIDGFSITIRRQRGRPRFRFTTERLTVNQLRVDLSASLFDEVGQEHSDGRRFVLGARRFGYTESFYFGNPGHYQTYLLAHNSAAGEVPNFPTDLPSFASGTLRGVGDDDDLCDLVSEGTLVVDLRRMLRVNTLTVLDIGSEEKDILMSYLGTGVDSDDVRRIPE